MNLDIQTTVRTIFFFLLIAGAAMVLAAVRAFREAGRLRFFLKKRELLGRAWKFVFYSLLIIVFAILINSFAEPLTYRVFQPSPTASLTPTITLTPTASITPTVTNTPTITQTPEFTSTPLMPIVISQNFTSEVTPNPGARFSNPIFSRSLDDEYQAIDPSETFENPIDTLFGSFSYESMITNSQWSALWFREGELIFYESKLWNGASGGFGYTDCKLPAEQWLPGQYEVQIFVGEIWKTSSFFSITGTPPTPTVTSTPTLTLTPTITPAATGTPQPTATLTPTQTYTTTPTRTETQVPSSTPTLTNTPVPSQTATMTLVPSPTLVPTATRRSTIYR
jgi:hypothetical protein